MEVALTFGSLGGIIQVCQLAIQLGRAVGVSKAAAGGESAKEYQLLRDDLDLFVGVVATYEQHELTPYLHGLDAASKSVVENCTTLIKDTLTHLQSRYGCSLTKHGSERRVKDVCKRIEWCVREKDRIKAVRDGLQEGVQRLTLLTALAARKSAHVDNATVLARIEEIRRVCQHIQSSRDDVLDLLKKQRAEDETRAAMQHEKLDQIQTQLGATEQNSRTILTLARDALRGTSAVTDLLISVAEAVANLQIMASNAALMRSLDSTKGLPVVLEDALGRPLEIPAEWIDTLEWNVVLAGLLNCQFKGKKGQDMVRRQQYALEEKATGRDLYTAIPLYYSLRRGMKVHMSMIFFDDDTVVGSCPRCHATTDAPEDVTIQCAVPGCEMWFRLQKSVIDVRASAGLQPMPDIQEETHMFKDTTVVTSIPIDPGDFQRVRMLQISGKLELDDVASVTDTSASYLDADRLGGGLESLDLSDRARKLSVRMMENLRNLNCSNETSDEEVEQDADEEFWKWPQPQRTPRRRAMAINVDHPLTGHPHLRVTVTNEETQDTWGGPKERPGGS